MGTGKGINKMDKQFIDNSINNAKNDISKLSEDILKTKGWSSNKVRHLLNNLCSIENINYLEIGLLHGSTFLSSLYKNNFNKAYGIDILLQPDLKPLVDNYLDATKIELFQSECFSFDKTNIINKIDIYLYDGGHEIEDQEKAFTYYNDILKDNFLCVIDDWNDNRVKTGTKLAFEKLKYKVNYEVELLSAGNCDTSSWWNGIYIGLIEKQI